MHTLMDGQTALMSDQIELDAQNLGLARQLFHLQQLYLLFFDQYRYFRFPL